jgi:hypothetical protein
MPVHASGSAAVTEGQAVKWKHPPSEEEDGAKSASSSNKRQRVAVQRNLLTDDTESPVPPS